MEFWKSIWGLLRRRYVGPPVLLLAIVAAAVTYMLVPTHYVSRAFMVLATPAGGGTLSLDPSKPTGLTNPLLNFNDGLKTTTGILMQAVNTPEEMEALGAGPKTQTTVVINDGSTSPDLLSSSQNGPFIYIEGDSTTPAMASGVVLKAQQKIRAELVSRQEALNAPKSTFLTMVDVIAPTTPVSKMTTKLQLTGVAAVLVLVLGLGGAYARERLRESRRLRAPDNVAELTSSPGELDPPTLRIARAKDKAVLTVRGDTFSGTLGDDTPHETV
jgi:membrane protein implicated in regulation of membrane protease activity